MAAKQKAPVVESGELTEGNPYFHDDSEIRGMLDVHYGAMDEEAIANTPQFVRKTVQEELFSCQRRFSLDIPSEAKACLAQKLTEVVGRTIRLALDQPEAFRAEKSSGAVLADLC
jgi:hypothetical protein